MTRPLRIEFQGATYHVTARGDRREAIFADDHDRLGLLSVIAEVFPRLQARMLSYCLMGNHYHFVVQTGLANLSRVMHQINGVYTQRYNRRHQKAGHVFQGRYKAILVDCDAYLLQVCRYVERNPLAAGLVKDVGAWRWSSFRAHAAMEAAQTWLDSNTLYGYLLGRDLTEVGDYMLAAQAYARWVTDTGTDAIWKEGLRQQIFLGDQSFVQQMQTRMNPDKMADKDIPREQRSAVRRLADWLALYATREEAIYRAYSQGAFSMSQMARELGLSVSRVSRLAARGREAAAKSKA